MWETTGEVAEGWIKWSVKGVSVGDQKLLTRPRLGNDPSAGIGYEAPTEVGPVVFRAHSVADSYDALVF